MRKNVCANLKIIFLCLFIFLSGCGGGGGPQTPSLDAPSNLNVSVLSLNSVRLTWNDNSNNETGFQIERGISETSGFNQVDTVGTNVTTYDSVGLDSETTYYFRVKAFNSVCDSAYSTVVSVYTTISVPIAPSGLVAEQTSGNSIQLTWVDNSTNESGFKIERSIINNTSFSEVSSVGPNITNFNQTNLTLGQRYYYRIRAFNTAGNSEYSVIVSINLPQTPIPAAPSGLTATMVGSTVIRLDWIDNSTNEEGFTVQHSTISGTAGFQYYGGVNQPNVRTLICQSLDAGTHYFRIYAFNSNGNSPYSEVASATLPITVPAAPSQVTATPLSSSAIHLTWQDNSNSETGFKIWCSIAGADFILLATVGANVTSYEHSGLPSNTVCYYFMRSYNSAGDSLLSNSISATTLSGP